jgi:MFS family permease
MADAARRDDGGTRLVLGLCALNVLAYVDRQLLAALAPLLIADLGLSRADVGLLVGLTFIVVFALGTGVVGSLADSGSRPRLIAGGLATWSAATALTGTATGFASLAFWRSLVGAGEATLPAPALSMIADRVAPERRGLANGVFYAGIPVGFALAFALAGTMGPALGWRACFFVLGPLGLLGVFAVARMADPPRRGAARPAAGVVESFRALAAAVAARPALGVLTLAGVLVVFASASSQHVITWLVQERGFEFRRAALLSSGLMLAAGLAGNLGIGALTDRARRRHPGDRLLALAGLAALGLAATFGFYTLSPGSPLFLPCWFVAQAFLLGWYGAWVAGIDELAPEGRKATSVGAALLVLNLLGVATGPWITGLIGDRAGLGAGLLWSLAPAVLGALLFAAVGLSERRAAPAEG